MKRLKIVLMLITVSMLFFGCKNRGNKIDEGFRFEEDKHMTEIEITKSFIYLFPSPGEILDRFYTVDLQYMEGELHDPALSDRYLTSKDKGLNLGVYLSDMAYAALFSRNSDAAEYLDVIRKLSGDLNVSTTAFESLIERAKSNMGARDSLVSISNEAFFNMLEFLESSGQEQTIAIISAGAYVETIFLALGSVDVYNENDPVIRQISELKYPMENLMSHVEQEAEDPNVQSILSFIRELNEMFAELEEKSSTAEVSEPGVITFSGGSIPEINEENFNEMKSRVIRIREEIIRK